MPASPCSVSEPVGHTVAQWPQETHAESAIVSASDWNPISVSSPVPSTRNTPDTCTSLQASTQRVQVMHLLRSIWMNDEVSSSGSYALRSSNTPNRGSWTPVSMAASCSSQRPFWLQVVHRRLWSDNTRSRFTSRASRASAASVRTATPSSTGLEHAATNSPSASTVHVRHVERGPMSSEQSPPSRSYAHSAGTVPSYGTRSIASRSVDPAGTDTSVPSTVTVTASPAAAGSGVAASSLPRRTNRRRRSRPRLASPLAGRSAGPRPSPA